MILQIEKEMKVKGIQERKRKNKRKKGRKLGSQKGAQQGRIKAETISEDIMATDFHKLRVDIEKLPRQIRQTHRERIDK